MKIFYDYVVNKQTKYQYYNKIKITYHYIIIYNKKLYFKPSNIKIKINNNLIYKYLLGILFIS